MNDYGRPAVLTCLAQGSGERLRATVCSLSLVFHIFSLGDSGYHRIVDFTTAPDSYLLLNNN